MAKDDSVFPRIYSLHTPDGFARAEVPGWPGMDGPSFEYHMFASATGADWTEAELEQACERIINLDRALQVRNHGRTRKDDESIIPNYERPENWVNPLLAEPQRLDRARFLSTLDEYYSRRGWDSQSGWPTREKLAELGLEGVADALEQDATNRSLPSRAPSALPSTQDG